MAILLEKEFYSIGEVKEITAIPEYVIRYWEKVFSILHPARRISGQRKYTKKDIDLILEIKDLRYNKKFTIEGVKKFLKEKHKQKSKQLNSALEENAAITSLKEVKKELQEILRLLE